MKVSTRGKYGLQLLVDLKENRHLRYVPLGTVSERQGISVRYLEYVAIILKRQGILNSLKGVAGGYALKQDPENINIGEVLRVLEGGMEVIEPLKQGEKESSYRNVVRKSVFENINKAIATRIDSVTLEQLSKGLE